VFIFQSNLRPEPGDRLKASIIPKVNQRNEGRYSYK